MMNASSESSRRRCCQPVTGRTPIRVPQVRWECTCCGKLLGTIDGGRLHLKIARGREYLAGFPATCACPRCGTLNEYTGNPEGAQRATHN